MNIEKNPSLEYQLEQEPKIIIRKSSEAPPEVKENPFYDPEFWGRAYSPDDIYLPDSDEAISFAMAAHEIGHLVREGEKIDAALDDFEATRAEEERAWDKGWEYLEKYLQDYYRDNTETIYQIKRAHKQIKRLLMKATDLSESMYLEKGALDNLSPEDEKRIVKEKKEKLFSEKGDQFRIIFNKIKKKKIGQKPDWDRFAEVVTKAVEDILEDNKKLER